MAREAVRGLAASMAASATAWASETATAQITSATSQGGGVTQYALQLNNTSTDGSTIGTFWFSWIPGQDYMPVAPSSVIVRGTAASSTLARVWVCVIAPTIPASREQAHRFPDGKFR